MAGCSHYERTVVVVVVVVVVVIDDDKGAGRVHFSF
jgi:hypothetical protein